MKIHAAELIGQASLDTAPVNDNDLVRKIDLTSSIAAGSEPIFITDVQPTGAGNTGLATYTANTVPANSVMETVVADTGNLRVFFLAESGQTLFSPSVQYNSSPVTTLTEVAGDRRLYEGYVDVNLVEDGDVTLVSSTGASATVSIDLQIGGPAITALTLGALPGVQTEVKENDVIAVTGTVENSATGITVVNFEAAKSGTLSLGVADSAGVGFKTITGNIVVSSRSGTGQNLRITATNLLGSIGTPFDSSNTVTLSQVFPTIGARSINYPAGQQAVKNTQTFTVDATITNFDTLTYSFERGTVTSPTAYAASKSLTVNQAIYDTSAVYSISANRAANDATTSANTSVYSAGVAATLSITIAGAPARLRSSPTGLDHTIIISSNQVMHSSEAPVMSASIGVFQGSWAKVGNTWQRALRITDGDAIGAATFSGLSLMNAALIETTAINSGASYTVGGFSSRIITIPAFAQEVALGLTIGNNSKTRVKLAGTEDLLSLRADLLDASASYSFTNGAGVYAASGGIAFWLSDVAFAGANTSGTLQVEIEEII